jgi:1,4-alpha-glucan branching enzyme
MPRRNGRKGPTKKRMTFRIAAPEAARVNLVGSFNEWDPGARTMRRDGKGTWKTSMMLEPGTYEFRYLVDGEWRNDVESMRVSNPFGTENCFRVVT